MKNYKEKLNHLKAFVFDVDGVLTDGSVYLMPDGSIMRKMNCKDGFAIAKAIKKGYKVAIITGGGDKMVSERIKKLGVYNVYMKSTDKVSDFKDFLMVEDLDESQVAYMGDDVPDLGVLDICGLSSCPKNAGIDVLSIAEYVSPKNGGEGCVRDLIEQTMKAQNKWLD